MLCVGSGLTCTVFPNGRLFAFPSTLVVFVPCTTPAPLRTFLIHVHLPTPPHPYPSSLIVFVPCTAPAPLRTFLIHATPHTPIPASVPAPRARLPTHRPWGTCPFPPLGQGSEEVHLRTHSGNDAPVLRAPQNKKKDRTKNRSAIRAVFACPIPVCALANLSHPHPSTHAHPRISPRAPSAPTPLWNVPALRSRCNRSCLCGDICLSFHVLPMSTMPGSGGRDRMNGNEDRRRVPNGGGGCTRNKEGEACIGFMRLRSYVIS